MVRRPIRAAAVVMLGMLAGVVPHAAAAGASTTVVISQVYGGGGDTGAAYAADYIELHNLTSSAVTLSGWALQYSFDTSTSPMLYQLSPFLIGTSIPAHGYFLVREHFGPKVCKNVVPRTVRLSEAPSFGQPIIAFDPSSRGAIAYKELAKEVSGGTPQRAG